MEGGEGGEAGEGAGDPPTPHPALPPRGGGRRQTGGTRTRGVRLGWSRLELPLIKNGNPTDPLPRLQGGLGGGELH